jgi:hypothetical protein
MLTQSVIAAPNELANMVNVLMSTYLFLEQFFRHILRSYFRKSEI